MTYDKARRHEYYVNNKNKTLAQSRSYYINHREHVIKRTRNWQKCNKNKFREIQMRYELNHNRIRFPGKIYAHLSWDPYKDECSQCKRKVGEDIKRTNMHHALGYFIIFPWFGLQELCVRCHNAERNLPKNLGTATPKF